MKQLQPSGDHCVTATKSFFIGEAVAIVLLLALGLFTLFDGSSSSRDIFLLLLIYAVFGGLHFFGRLSNLACPAKVLLAGFVFISASVSLNAVLF